MLHIIVICLLLSMPVITSFQPSFKLQKTSLLSKVKPNPTYTRGYRLPQNLFASTYSARSDESIMEDIHNYSSVANTTRVHSAQSQIAWISSSIQLFLTAVAGGTLMFVNQYEPINVVLQHHHVNRNLWVSGMGLSLAGVALSCINILWQWTATRCTSLSNPYQEDIVFKWRRPVNLSVALSLATMWTSLFATQQILGWFVLTGAADRFAYDRLVHVRLVDVFLLQANVNVLIAAVVSLCRSCLLSCRTTPVTAAVSPCLQKKNETVAS